MEARRIARQPQGMPGLSVVLIGAWRGRWAAGRRDRGQVLQSPCPSKPRSVTRMGFFPHGGKSGRVPTRADKCAGLPGSSARQAGDSWAQRQGSFDPTRRQPGDGSSARVRRPAARLPQRWPPPAGRLVCPRPATRMHAWAASRAGKRATPTASVSRWFNSSACGPFWIRCAPDHEGLSRS